MTEKSVRIGPILRIKITVHQELSERKEPKCHPIRQYFPVLGILDRLYYRLEVIRGVEFFIFREGREIDAEIVLQPCFERKIWFDVFFAPLEPKALGRSLSLKIDWNQNEGCVSGRV